MGVGSTEAVVVSTAVGAAVFMVVGAGASMVVVEAFTAAVASAVVVIIAAGGRLVEEVTAKAAAFVESQGLVFMERAVVLTAGLKRAAVLVQAEIERQIFVRQSTMGSGIRSAAPAVPRV